MRNLILPVSLLLLAACGGNSNNAAQPTDPSTTNATPPASETATPAGAATGAPTGEPVPATLAPTDGKASGDEKCGPVATPTAAALDACLAECERLSDTSPQGAKCLPPRAACKSHCNTKFKK